jgi:hypothetical protein
MATLPEEVRRLIAEHIVSVEQLEVLLLLREGGSQREWTAEAVSEHIRSSPGSASHRLADLHRRGFLARSEGDPPRFRYAPDDRSARAVDSLARSYNESKYTVIELIFSKPIENLRVYSNAFRFRKDGENDG